MTLGKQLRGRLWNLGETKFLLYAFLLIRALHKVCLSVVRMAWKHVIHIEKWKFREATKLTMVRHLLCWKAETFKQVFLILKDIKCSDLTCSRGHKEGTDIFFGNVTRVTLGKTGNKEMVSFCNSYLMFRGHKLRKDGNFNLKRNI